MIPRPPPQLRTFGLLFRESGKGSQATTSVFSLRSAKTPFGETTVPTCCRHYSSLTGNNTNTNNSSSSSSNNNNNRKSYHLDSPQQRDFTSLNCETPYQLVFLRHGQSTWNRDNRFIGWTDTPLTDDGVLEARVAGDMLAKSGIMFDEIHTSLLRRCIRTTNLVLMEMGQEYLPVYKHWRLNERHYGDLVGKNKKEVVLQFGKDQVKRWRRSYDEPPPMMEDDHPYHPAKDPRYHMMKHKLPLAESLKCTMERSRVYWDEAIAPSLKNGKTILIVGHENNLRSLIMRLEDISEEEIIELCLPRAVPLAYRLDENLKPLDRPDGQLDEATGFLRGEWLGGDRAVADILERDRKQVYDTSNMQNLELGSDRDKWNTWMEFLIGKPGPEARANIEEPKSLQYKPTPNGDGAVIPGVDKDPFLSQGESEEGEKRQQMRRAA